MNNSLTMHHLDPLNHLNSHVENGFEVKLPPALLKQVLKTFAKHVHYHHVVTLSILCLSITNEVQIWDSSFSSELMNEFRLPKKHDMLLTLDSLFDLSCQVVSSLLLLDFVNFSESTTSNSFDDFVPLIKNFLTFFHLLFTKFNILNVIIVRIY